MWIARLVMSCAAMVLTAGCTSVNLSDGQALASAGSTLAAQMRDDAQQAADDERLNSERSALRSVLAKARSRDLKIAVTDPDVAADERVADLLQARTKTFDALLGVYGSLQAGTSRNVAAESANAFATFTSAVDAYTKSVAPHGAQVENQPEMTAAGEVAGLFASYLQKRNMVRASHLISAQLPKVRAGLVREQQANVYVRATNALIKHRLADSLRSLGIADATPDLDAAAKLAGTTRADDALKIYEGDPRLKEAFADYNQWLDSTYEQQLITNEYQQLINGIDNLMKQHRRFESGEPLDLGVLTQDAEQIKSICDSLRGKSNG